ncbi:MAG: carboxypeptidase-like regulatory domain-containing protein [Candidatus Aminicenantes bacterium]|nr:carboxypeptidase-like regulatory domain-containing protein [Candidatus Aminicenantes bacterium]
MRNKPFIGFVLASFILFLTPVMQADSVEATSTLVGFIYAEDGVTPVEGAVFKISNVKTNQVYASGRTDELGIFKIDGIEQGMYLAGINTAELAYALPNVLGFKGGETAKLSLALQPGQKFPAPRNVQGEKALNFLGLSGPAAWAALAAIVAVLGISILDLLNVELGDWFIFPEDEASPFKKK